MALRFVPRILALRAMAAVLAVIPWMAAAPNGWADVRPEMRVKILFTALGFNRTLAASEDFEVVVAVLGDCPTFEALVQAQDKKLNGKPISVIKATAATYAYLERSAINVVYVCDIKEDDAAILSKAAPRLGIAILAEKPELVQAFALMGVREQDGRTRLLLNMKAAREAKIELDPRILGAADIVVE